MDGLLQNIAYLFAGMYIFYSLIILGVYFVTSIKLWFTYKPSESINRISSDSPLVSIIVPAYNEEVSIVECIRSLSLQDYPNKEIIIVDDGSTDKTLEEVVDNFNLRYVGGMWRGWDIYLIKTENKGKWSALNTGLEFARGKWVLNVDADTILVKTAISRTVELLREDTDAVSCFIGVANGNKIIDGKVVTNGVPRNWLARIQWLEYIRCFLLWRTANDKHNATLVLPGAYSFMKRDLVLELGGYKEGYLSEDMELTMNIIKNGGKIQFISEFLAWTEVPENLRDLTKQRLRWYRGGLQNLITYWKMLFSRKRSKFVGWYMLPFLWFADVFGIWVELFGLIQLFIYWYMDIPIEWNLVWLSIVIIVSMYYFSMISLVCFAKRKIFKNNNIRLHRVLPVILLEPISYHFINLYWMLKSHINQYLHRGKHWNKFKRKGF
jgi:cellulose synthase/poly-beta-1,6-N-acetylglucosamine synthase-like glycosyltransferase